MINALYRVKFFRTILVVVFLNLVPFVIRSPPWQVQENTIHFLDYFGAHFRTPRRTEIYAKGTFLTIPKHIFFTLLKQ